MKTLFTGIIFMLMAINCFAQDLLLAKKEDLYTQDGLAYYNGQRFTGILIDTKTGTQKLGEYKNGYKLGPFKDLYENGNKKSEGNYLYGSEEGLFTEWFENSKKKSEINYAGGVKNGLTTEWYPNGNKKCEVMFARGNLNGEYTEYYENGNTKSVSHYLNGKLNGISEQFDESGKKQVSCNYSNGLKQGKLSEWHSNGKLKKELTYNNDQLADGIIIEYDQAGQKLSELECKFGAIISSLTLNDNLKTCYYNFRIDKKESQGHIKNGLKEGNWTEWWESGEKKFEGNYLNGQRNGRGIEYTNDGIENWNGEYKDGKKDGIGTLIESSIIYKGTWSKGLKNGAFIVTNKDKSVAEGKYLNDQKNESWLEKFPNGNKKLEVQYTNGVISDGNYTEWYENGQKKEEKLILNGKPEGKHTQWHSNGKVASSLNYKNGKIVDGQYFQYDNNGYIEKEFNYTNGIIRSIYSYGAADVKNGSFSEYYADGKTKITGHYDYGKRKVDERYGANKKSANFFRALGALTLLIVIIGASAMLGTL